MDEDMIRTQVPKIEMFKGKPVITLNPEDKWPFTFGITKAKLIIQNLDAIKAFIESQQTPGAQADDAA